MAINVHDKLQALFAAYTESLPRKMLALENHWHLLQKNWSNEELINFYREIHSLCGSSGTYGHIGICKAARRLEERVKKLLDCSSLSDEDVADVSRLLFNLKSTPASNKKGQASIAGIRSLLVSKAIYVLEKDSEFSMELSASLESMGYLVKNFGNFERMKQVLLKNIPIAVMVDAAFLTEEVVQFFHEMKNRDINIPLFVTADNGNLQTRLCAIRAGGCAFFQKPIDVFYLTKAIDQICGSIVNEPLRVLIVDDSESLVDYYSLLLQEAGMETRAITDPLRMLDVLTEYRANLILLDVYMPNCSGLELATVLRQEMHYANVPIIFLSTEGDRFKQLTALTYGGDDFLTKPIQPHHLVSAVRTRAERANFLNSFMTRDGLSGLLNHTSILQHLDMEIMRARRNNTPLCFIMIDIDHFKSVNDTHGHPVGDRVIQKLAEVMFSRLRKTDFIGRYGGEEFAIILPNTDAETALLLCESIREQFMQVVFETDNAEFSVTFSAGIASYPALSDAKALISAADQALYKAKHQGRNRELVYDLVILG